MLFFMMMGGEETSGYKSHLKIDENLFQKIGEGDRCAFEELYRITERSIYAYVLSLLKNPYDAQDIVQETYLKIRMSAHLYQPQGKPMAWIFTISRNLVHNFQRKQSQNTDIESYDIENNSQFAYVTDPTDRLILEGALTVLAEDERQILFLHAVSGICHREIASDLGLPLSTVLSRYYRSLKKMKKYLQIKEGD
ncbi:MAG: RNA polymerase sigma factor, partial [Hungatella sp.]